MAIFDVSHASPSRRSLISRLVRQVLIRRVSQRKPALIKSPVVLAVLRRIGGAEKVAQGVKAGERESTKAE